MILWIALSAVLLFSSLGYSAEIKITMTDSVFDYWIDKAARVYGWEEDSGKSKVEFVRDRIIQTATFGQARSQKDLGMEVEVIR